MTPQSDGVDEMLALATARPDVAELLHRLNSHRLMMDGGNGNVYDTSDPDIDDAITLIVSLQVEIAALRSAHPAVDDGVRTALKELSKEMWQRVHGYNARYQVIYSGGLVSEELRCHAAKLDAALSETKP